MDFHSLTRRELQTLCKMNKIPANITNVAMADALKALQFVEGIEELLNPSESVTAQSSIESPERTEVTSPRVPRTGGRTTRRKTVKNEVENSQTLTRTRRSTRKLVETPSASNGKANLASVCRKMDAELKDVSETPSVLPTSRRRGQKLMGDNTAIRTYSTRRSARLSEKNAIKKIEIVQTELFAEESGENEEIPERDVLESSNDLGEIIETTDIDLKKESEGELERNNVKELSSDKKTDGSNEDDLQFDSSKLVKESNESFVAVNPEVKIEDNGVVYRAPDDLKTEVHSEVVEEKDTSADTFDEPLEMHDAVQGKRCDDLYLNKAEEDALAADGDNMDVNKEMVSENLVAETAEEVIFAQDDAFTTEDKALEINEEIIDLAEGGNSESPDDHLPVSEEVHENARMENDVGFLTLSADNVEMDQCSKDLAALDINDGALKGDGDDEEVPVAEESVVILPEPNEQGIDLISAQELLGNSPLEEECADNNMMMKEDSIAQELNASVDLLPELAPEGCGDVVRSLEEVYYVDNNMMKDAIAQEWNASVDLLPELTASADEEGSDVVGYLGEEYVENKMIEETTDLELNDAPDDTSPKKTYEAVDSEIQEASAADDDPLFSNALTAPTVDDDNNNNNNNTREFSSVFDVTAELSKTLESLPEAEQSENVLPTCLLTPSKKSASNTTPMKKSAGKKTPKKLNHPFDDKENIDNNGSSKMILLTKEKKKKSKDFGVSKTIPQYGDDVSLRKLKKVLKEKLETDKNRKKEEEAQVSSRPALQAVSENTYSTEE